MADEQLGTDLMIKASDLVVLPTGEVEIVFGLACLAQDLANRLATPRGGLWSDPTYGVRIYDHLQAEDTPVNRLDFEQELREAAEADPRVVPGSAQVEVSGWERGQITARVTVTPIDGGHPLNLVLGYGLDNITTEVIGLGL